ncbi:MAG: YiiX/YebB-like N1pC/P60 family cysteine hydrolase [Parvibaculaceae bacterium]|nr:YiiX/YebB-like N1pC/P60 family cysteine hydrolase [Parvibaculaceae bacterium]
MKNEKEQTGVDVHDNTDGTLRVTIADLLPGDILLHRSATPTKLQRKITEVTSGPYTHASIYLGDKTIAEAVLSRIQKIDTTKSIDKDGHIAVLRSQASFQHQRPQKLVDFIDALISNGSRYDVRGALSNPTKHQRFFDNYLSNIEKNYGASQTTSELEKRNYFCSALVVASLFATGVIGESAQVGYPPDVFSPTDLLSDPTFGWLLGFIHTDDYIIPPDDPALLITSWKDQQN